MNFLEKLEKEQRKLKGDKVKESKELVEKELVEKMPEPDPEPKPEPEENKKLEETIVSINSEDSYTIPEEVSETYPVPYDNEHNNMEVELYDRFPGEDKTIDELASGDSFVAFIPKEAFDALQKVKGARLRYLRIVKPYDIKKGRAEKEEEGLIGWKENNSFRTIDPETRFTLISIEARKYWGMGVTPSPNIAESGYEFLLYLASDIDDIVYVFTVKGSYATGRMSVIKPGVTFLIGTDFIETDMSNFYCPNFVVTTNKLEIDKEKFQKMKKFTLQYIAKQVDIRKEKGIL